MDNNLELTFTIDKETQEKLKEILNAGGLKHYLIKLENNTEIDVVEYKDYKKLIDGINNLKEYIKQEMILDFYNNELPLEVIIEKLLRKIQEFNNEDS